MDENERIPIWRLLGWWLFIVGLAWVMWEVFL